MESIIKLRSKFNKVEKNYKELKLAILGDSASQFFVQGLKAYGIKNRLNIKILESNFDQIKLQVFNINSSLYKFQPDFIFLNFSTQKLLNQFYRYETRDNFFLHISNEMHSLIKRINSELSSTIILNNFNEINDNVFGNYASKVTSSFLYQIRKINLDLMVLSQKNQNIFICDLISIQNILGEKMFDQRLYYNSKLAYSIQGISYISKNVVQIICSNIGLMKKCLILDLDNTLWGGVVGDDGINGIELGEGGLGEIYIEIQQWILELKNRGIILAVCSKNTKEVAKEVFDKHPNMLIKMKDISIFKANWRDKTDNILEIKENLNIDLNSMVFVDDSPFERDLVRKNLPTITVAELPDDPSNYLEYLRNENYFEVSSITESDLEKTKLFKEESKRKKSKTTFKSNGAFLKSLKMIAKVDNINTSNLKRVFQLIQKTNQFNTTNRRYSQNRIKEIIDTKYNYSRVISLKDNYGSYGIISCIILKKVQDNLIIDTWIMSCRVFDRQIENFAFNHIIKLAKHLRCKKVICLYKPTKKNIILIKIFKKCNFKKIKAEYSIIVENTIPLKNYIKLKN